MQAEGSKRKAPPSRQEHACPTCGQVFSRAEYARRHWRAKHEPGAAALRCAACDTGFSRPDILARHIRMYHKEGAESETAAAEFSLAAAAAADIAVPAPIPLVPTSPTARKQASATEEPAAPDSTAAAVTVPAAQEALSEEFDREWQLPLPPPAEPLSGVPEIAAGATLEAFLQAGDSTSSLSIGGVAQVTESSSPEGHASPEIFLPWDFPALDKTSNPAPAKRARAAAVPAQSAPGRTSPSSDSGQSSDCSHSSPLRLLAATGIASTSTSGEPAAPPLPTMADSELDLLQELHTLPSATPPIRADEIMCNRSLRPRYYAMQLYDDEANEDWVEAEFEDDGVASWLQGATVKPIRSKEPDMYPGLDHLFGVERNTSSRFWMANQRFCIAYLYPWELPPLSRLSKFAFQASKTLLPVLPLAHGPSIVLNTVEPTFAFALSVAGAGLFETHSSFFDEMSRIKREFAAEHLGSAKLGQDELLASVQTLLLYQLLGAFSKSTEEQEYTRKHHALLVQKFLELEVPPCEIPANLDLPERDLRRIWQAWVVHETYIRVAFLCYLLDIRHGETGGLKERLLAHNHPALSQLPLPANDSLWNAETPVSWREGVEQRRRHNASFSPRVQGQASRLLAATTEINQPAFSTVLNSLLSRKPPAQGSEAARSLAALSPTSPLAVAVLLQTLLSIASQLSASENLLRSLVGSVSGSVPNLPAPSIIAAAAASTQDSQERVQFGLRVVRVLGGAVAQDRWFNGMEAIYR
ncbi:hypothetical protein JCM8115_005658 [Rhodotorula mucilaginosa]|nr:hypothetical protein B0A53_04472 [Rhodotorula sp. CCFEE 5036]